MVNPSLTQERGPKSAITTFDLTLNFFLIFKNSFPINLALLEPFKKSELKLLGHQAQQLQCNNFQKR